MNAEDDQPLIYDLDRSDDIDSEMEIVANNLEDQEDSIEKNGQVTNDVANRKVFVDRLPRFVKPSDLRSHFSAFGRIEDIQLNLRMGSFSAFVVYKSVEAAKKAVDAKHKINGVKVR
jgi:RNA recognition motif-containing protein